MDLFLFILKNWFIVLSVWVILVVLIVLLSIIVNLVFMISTALSPNAKFAESEFYFKDILLKDLKKRFCKEKRFKFLDIGAGNGAVILSVATKLDNSITTGVEFNRLLYLWGQFLVNSICFVQRWLGNNCKERINWVFGDAFQLKDEFYKQFDVVYIFTQMYRLLEYQAILQKLKKGTLVYTLYFPLPKTAKAFKRLKTFTRFGQHLYVYKKVK